MFLSSRILFMLTETPLHAGTGATLGNVDLPIQRERPTDYPLVYASGVKGALRSEAPKDDATTQAVFGPEPTAEDGLGYAGAVSPGDARLLLFPVRSLTGVYAWTTSLHVLHRFRRDVEMAGLTLPELAIPEPTENQAYVSGRGVSTRNTVVLEEFSFTTIEDAESQKQVAALAGWLAEHALPGGPIYQYWRDKLKTSLVILPEDAYRDFARYATEVVTRVRLDPQTKTVVPGALWTEEFLPVDSLLYVPVHATRLRSDDSSLDLSTKSVQEQADGVLQWMEDTMPERIQLGGDETVGRGLISLRWNGGRHG